MPKTPHDPGFWTRAKEAMNGNKVFSNYQTEIAGLLKIKQPSVYEWEAGESMPSIRNTIKLATRTNVCVEWLYTGRGAKHPGPPDEPLAKKLWSAWGNLTDEEKSELCAYALIKAEKKQSPLLRKRNAA